MSSWPGPKIGLDLDYVFLRLDYVISRLDYVFCRLDSDGLVLSLSYLFETGRLGVFLAGCLVTFKQKTMKPPPNE